MISAAASGRRGGTQDYVHQAVEIAKAFPDVPVKMIWSREEDQGARFLPAHSQCKLSAGLDAEGNLVGLHVRVSGQSINAMLNPKGIVDGKDLRQLQGYSATPGDAQLGYCRAQPADRICRCATRMFRSGPGAGSTPIRTASTWNASWTRWRRRPARTRSSFAVRS
jgi:hypothetical protein